MCILSVSPVLSRAQEAATAPLEKKEPQVSPSQGISTMEKKYPAPGAKQPSAAELAAAMKGMGSGMASMMGEMYNAILDLFAKKETAVKLAVFAKNYYDELIKVGFTKEEALQMVTRVGVPSLSGK
jgi:hypothetical protein